MQEVRERKPGQSQSSHECLASCQKPVNNFRGGKEISNCRPCYHNDIKLLHEHLGDIIRLGSGNRRQTVAQDQIWPAAYYCMAYKPKMDFMFLNQKKIVKIIKIQMIKFTFHCT